MQWMPRMPSSGADSTRLPAPLRVSCHFWCTTASCVWRPSLFNDPNSSDTVTPAHHVSTTGVQSLWGHGNLQVHVINGLVLVPFPMHFVKSIVICELDPSLDLAEAQYLRILQAIPSLFTAPVNQVKSLEFLHWSTNPLGSHALHQPLVDHYTQAANRKHILARQQFSPSPLLAHGCDILRSLTVSFTRHMLPSSLLDFFSSLHNASNLHRPELLGEPPSDLTGDQVEAALFVGPTSIFQLTHLRHLALTFETCRYSRYSRTPSAPEGTSAVASPVLPSLQSLSFSGHVSSILFYAGRQSPLAAAMDWTKLHLDLEFDTAMQLCWSLDVAQVRRATWWFRPETVSRGCLLMDRWTNLQSLTLRDVHVMLPLWWAAFAHRLPNLQSLRVFEAKLDAIQEVHEYILAEPRHMSVYRTPPVFPSLVELHIVFAFPCPFAFEGLLPLEREHKVHFAFPKLERLELDMFHPSLDAFLLDNAPLRRVRLTSPQVCPRTVAQALSMRPGHDVHVEWVHRAPLPAFELREVSRRTPLQSCMSAPLCSAYCLPQSLGLRFAGTPGDRHKWKALLRANPFDDWCVAKRISVQVADGLQPDDVGVVVRLLRHLVAKQSRPVKFQVTMDLAVLDRLTAQDFDMKEKLVALLECA